MKLNKKHALVIGLVTIALAITGCASQSSAPTPTPTKSKTEAEIEKDFLKIADDSCNKAQTENIIEEVADGSRIISLAKANAYKDYSAVYIDAQGKAQVIYEMELTVCGPGYLISMQKEANHDNSGEYEHHVKLNKDGTYTWTQYAYGSGDTNSKENFDTTLFTVEDGIITAADTKAYDYTFQYGAISSADMEVFKKTIDAELERINQ